MTEPHGEHAHPHPGTLSAWFSHIAHWTSVQLGRAASFMLACLTIVVWGLTGPIFHYSDTWQLVINTGTTIVTFLMVFLIQNTQNRDMSALHLKLDELIRVNKDARNTLLNLEDMTEEELDRLKGNFSKLAIGEVDADQLRAAEADLSHAEQDIVDAREKLAGAVQQAKHS